MHYEIKPDPECFKRTARLSRWIGKWILRFGIAVSILGAAVDFLSGQDIILNRALNGVFFGVFMWVVCAIIGGTYDMFSQNSEYLANQGWLRLEDDRFTASWEGKEETTLLIDIKNVEPTTVIRPFSFYKHVRYIKIYLRELNWLGRMLNRCEFKEHILYHPFLYKVKYVRVAPFAYAVGNVDVFLAHLIVAADSANNRNVSA